MKKNIFPKSQPLKPKQGFVLVETIVAVSIILLVVPAILSMTTRGISLESYARSQMTANYLAEEGVEFIRNRRDANLLDYENGNLSTHWDDGFSGGSLCKSHPCTIDPLAGSGSIIGTCPGGNITSNPPSNCYRVYVDTNGFYSPASSGKATEFWRGVTVADIPSHPNEHVITSTVIWRSQFLQKSVTVTGYITNWLQ